MVSMAAPGASGAPVMDDGGRIVGMVQSRVTPQGVVSTGAVQSTLAAGDEELKAVLTAAGTPFTESAEAQLDAIQSRRDHAASFTVGLFCRG